MQAAGQLEGPPVAGYHWAAAAPAAEQRQIQMDHTRTHQCHMLFSVAAADACCSSLVCCCCPCADGWGFSQMQASNSLKMSIIGGIHAVTYFRGEPTSNQPWLLGSV